MRANRALGIVRAGLNYSSLKAFHGLTNTALGCWSSFSGEVLAAMRLNHICSWVTFTEPFTANWDSFLSSLVPPLSRGPVPIPRT